MDGRNSIKNFNQINMSKFKQEKKVEEKYEFPEYTNQELWALNNLLKEKYNDGKTKDDITHWMQNEGALGQYGGVIIDGSPCKYQVLQDKLQKANKLLGRKEFAVRKELESLEKTMKLD